MAEIIKNYLPRMVDLHNYPASHSMQQKVYNWNTLNSKVFRKMGFQIARSDIEQITNAQPDAIERVLKLVKDRVSFKQLERYLERRNGDPPVSNVPAAAGEPKPRLQLPKASEATVGRRQ